MGLTSADNAYMASTEPEPECDPGEGPQASGEGDGDVEASTNPSSTVHAANQSQIHAPSDGDLLEAAEYVNTVPTRWMGHKIRHQVKQRAARKVQALLELPGVLNRLRTLYTRHPIYVGPRVDHDHVLEEVGLPEEVLQITESFNPKGIRFKDIGHYDMFKCYGDCFMDTCENVASAVYCVLCAYDGLQEGQPDQELKQNSVYTILYNTLPTKKKYGYVEAVRAGDKTCFISHAYEPNAAFVDLHNRANVKVLMRMIKDVKTGAHITVNCGNETWFKCACDTCWKRSDNDQTTKE
ncbi:hypothetical protein PC119_g16847 [Phytophthora cactorum]|nr:hypothetical protein PC119_g16847 [Phytophthora cactorum]